MVDMSTISMAEGRGRARGGVTGGVTGSNQVAGSWLSELVSSAERHSGTVMRIMMS